jgi:hypothetical protein
VTWREVLERAGFTVRLDCGVIRLPQGGFWWVYVTQQPGEKWKAWVDAGDREFAAVDADYDTDELAFIALMAKPIGPGRVTVGVVLGLALPAGGG